MTTTRDKLEPNPATLLPFVSVIVPVRNEAKHIQRTLEQLLEQDYDASQFEVLVVDGQSTDRTREIVRALQADHPNLRLLANPRRWSSAGRNLAVTAARGDIVVVVDGHCDIEHSDYLRNLADAFARSGADCLGRPQPLDISSATRLQRAIAVARSCLLGHHHASFVYSATEQFVRPQSVAVAYRRAVFDRIGLFDETFDACEDVEFNHRLDRAGMRCFFTPRVRVRYHPRTSIRGLFMQMFRYGRGRMRLLRKHPDTFTAAGFLPAVFVLALVCGPLLALFSTWCAELYLAGLAVYALTLLLTSVMLACRERRASLLPLLPPVFATIHVAAGSGILHEWWAGRRRAAREIPDANIVPSGAPVFSARLRTRAMRRGGQRVAGPHSTS
jgi:succinoglycan biosynthesis protein ExoA